METDWKVPAGAAGVAFVIAMLTGLIAGVGFGAAFLRSIAGGAVFGLGAFGARALARKYLPELFRPNAAAAARQDDIEQEEFDDAGAVDITIAEENPHLRERRQEEDDSVDEFASEDDDIVHEAEVGELETVDDADDIQGVSEESGLPSFDSLESSFQTDGAPESDEEPGDSSVLEVRQASASDVVGRGEDPADIARAVRTLLKRDEQG